MTARAGLPAARAIVAQAEGRHDDVVAELLPVRRRLITFGGSNAQRDVLQRTLVDSAILAGHDDLAAALLRERRAARPTSAFVRDRQACSTPAGRPGPADGWRSAAPSDRPAIGRPAHGRASRVAGQDLDGAGGDVAAVGPLRGAADRRHLVVGELVADRPPEAGLAVAVGVQDLGRQRVVGARRRARRPPPRARPRRRAARPPGGGSSTPGATCPIRADSVMAAAQAAAASGRRSRRTSTAARPTGGDLAVVDLAARLAGGSDSSYQRSAASGIRARQQLAADEGHEGVDVAHRRRGWRRGRSIQPWASSPSPR